MNEIAQEKRQIFVEMIGVTRSRVGFFMNRLGKLGFVKYNGGMHVHSSLVSVG